MKNLKMFSSGIAMLVLFASFGVQKIVRSGRTEMTITGVVSDKSGPLPGASVIILETSRGTQTDANGKYSIKANPGQTLVFSFIGFESKQVKVKRSKVINVLLSGEAVIVDEVVVSSQGIKREKKEMGYATTNISEKDYSNMPVNGLAISNASPNASGKIIIRGHASKAKDKKVPHPTNNQLQHFDANAEDYDSFIENPFEAPKNAPLSTFSIDVDNASYTNVRRFINNGQKVPKDAVRVEEMVNFFKYRYPQPKDQHPFSINTEYSASPWNSNHKLLRIGLQGRTIPTDNLPASNLVFLVDVSGSMADGNKLPLLIQSLKILVKELRSEDKVAIVVYAGAAGLVLPPTSGSEKQTIIDALENLQAGGSTAGGAGIQLAYKTAEENFIKGGNNRVILATDGDFNVGANSNADMEKLIEEKRKSGVFLTCLGYGMGNYKDSKMETLADKGNGNYAYIDNIQEANRFLGKEFKGSMYAIAKDVKIQIEFNPNAVQAYRLIGYENRKLRPEDFTNDKIDAGELGSGHSVTALYEIIPMGVKSEFAEPSPALKYGKIEMVKGYNDELATVKFRYKKPDGDKSTEMVEVIGNKAETLANASDDFKFGAAVAWFGLKLRESKLVSNTSSEDIKKLAKSGLINDTDGYKAEFIRLVEGEIKFSVR
jgi:Ca-activated chloride channel family protein